VFKNAAPSPPYEFLRLITDGFSLNRSVLNWEQIVNGVDKGVFEVLSEVIREKADY
jgi:hypothetical protein